MSENITNATAKSKVTIDELGFSIVDEQEKITHVPWSRVQVIYGYKRFINQIGTLCLDFVLPENNAGEDAPRIIVEEGAQGWTTLNAKLEQVFPGLDRRWSDKVSVDDLGLGDIAPVYISNLTEVWKR